MLVDLLMTAGGTPLPPPTGLTSQVLGSTSLQLDWTDGGVYSVQVYRNGALLTTVSSGVETYTDNSVTSGVEYIYKLRHTSGTNFSVFTAELAAASAPPAPTSLTAEQDGTNVDLEWSNPSTSHDTVRVYRDASLIASLGSSALTHTDNSPAPASYNYTVRNYDSVTTGLSDVSNVAAITVIGAPSPPSSFTATADGQDTIDLSWTYGASDAETEVYRDTSPTPTTLITTLGTGVTTYEDTGLSASTTYYYRIRHKRSGLFSTYVSDDATTDSPAPDPPSGFSVTSTHSDRNALSWTTDGTSQIEVYRGTSYPATTLLTTLSATTNSYNDDTVSSGILYYYRIRHKVGASYSTYVEDFETTLTTSLSGVSITANSGTDVVSISYTVNNPPVAPTVDYGDWSDTGAYETTSAVTGQSISSPYNIVTYSPYGLVDYPGGTSTVGTLAYLRVRNGLGTVVASSINIQKTFYVSDEA